jgi:hypothetical protein
MAGVKKHLQYPVRFALFSGEVKQPPGCLGIFQFVQLRVEHAAYKNILPQKINHA